MTVNVASGRKPADVPEHLKLYWILWGVGMAIIFATSVSARVLWNILLFDQFGLVFNGGPTILLLVLSYLTLSLKEVPANEIAGAFCYGKALSRLSSGLHFAPFGLMQVKTYSRTVKEFQCPSEPEKVFKGDDKDPLPSGMVRPIRAVTRAPKDEEKGLLDTQMTLSINFMVQYAVTDVFDYIANFGNTEEIEKQLRDVGEVKVIEEITQNTASSFIENLPKINEDLVIKIKERFQNSGINIISVRLMSPDITHGVSEALANIPKAAAEAKQVTIKADGEKNKRIKEGEGTAAAELSLLTARSEGQKKILEALNVGGESVLAAEAVRGLSEKTDVIVVGAEAGMRDVMGLVKGAQSALNIKIKEGLKP